MLSAPLLGLFVLIVSITSTNPDSAMEELTQHLHRQLKEIEGLNVLQRDIICRNAASFLFLLGDITYNWKKTQEQIRKEVNEISCWDYEDLFRRAGSLSLGDVRDFVRNTIRFFKYLNGIRTPSSSFCCPPCYLGHSTPREYGRFVHMNESIKLGQWILRIADKFEKISMDQLDDVVLNYIPLRNSIVEAFHFPDAMREKVASDWNFTLKSAKAEIFNTFDGLRRRNRATVQLLLDAWLKLVDAWSRLTKSDTPKWTALEFLQNTEWSTSCFLVEPRVVSSVVKSPADPA